RRASAAAARLARPDSPTRLAARVAEPPRPPLGSHDQIHRLASRRASPSLRGRRSARTTRFPESPRGARRRASAAAARLARPDSPTRLAARVAEPPRPPLGSHDQIHRLASRRASPSLRGRRSARTTRFTDSPRGARRRASAAAARLALPYLEYVVERVALDRDLAGVLDHAEELLAREPGRRLGPRHVLHALVLERAIDVVGAEVERDRRGRLAEEYPVRLDVREVVQEEPGRGDRPEIVGGRRRPLHEPGRPDLVGEGNEGEESAGGVLLLPETQQVIHALGQCLHVAV